MGMNKLLALGTIVIALSVGAGCSRGDRAPAPSAVAPGNGNAAGGEAIKVGAPVAVGRSLVVTMDVAITVVDVDKARSAIRAELERAGGYVADASSSGSGEGRSAHLELRIPKSEVQGVRAALGNVGEITSDVEKVQDVTEERADIEARLHNARVEELRVLDIMTLKTGTIGEVIEAEKDLSRIRESIERMEAQKRTLEGRIDLATVRVTLTAQQGPAAWETPGKSIVSAGRAGGRAAAATGVYALMAFVAVAPIVLPIAALVLALVFFMRSRRRAGDAQLATARAMGG
jgi:hypothetical protein